MESAHVQQTYLNVSLVRKHIVVVGSAGTHRVTCSNVALLRYQHVLKHSDIKTVEHLIRQADLHSGGANPPLPIHKGFVQPAFKTNPLEVILFRCGEDRSKRDFDIENFGLVGRHCHTPENSLTVD